jgi:predicted AlkP superfamily phosphohydrolase/phosphomutase
MDAFHKKTGGYQGLFLLSDHGFTGIQQEVYLNSWLKKNGYLSFETDSPQKLTEITQETKAFAMDPNRIYINLKNKFPKGQVKKSEKNSLKNEITKKLENLNFEGEKVVEKVYDTDTIYSGPETSNGPDLIVLSKHGYDMKGSVKKEQVFGRSNLQGMHNWDEAFFWADKEQSSDLCISDLAEIILKSFDSSE